MDRLLILLDYVLQNVNDERLYFSVEALGLLDSGVSRTILGSKGYTILKDLGFSLKPENSSSPTVGNGNKCQILE